MRVTGVTTNSFQPEGFSRSHKMGTVSREDAESRLTSLPPETEEYAQLWSALRRASGIAEICMSSGNSYKVSVQKDRLLGGFAPSENFFIGESVELGGIESSNILCIGNFLVRFSHVLAVAGDFYRVVNQSVSLLGGTEQDKEKRFMAAFFTLEKADPWQLQNLIIKVEEEYHAAKHSGGPPCCYDSYLIQTKNRFNAIKGDTDALFVDNSDHFAECARDVYLIGHGLACREAAAAGLSGNQEQLRRAYALEAFACHFLADLFAAGRIRNQRGVLEIFLKRLGCSEQCAKSLSVVLAAAQHAFDGRRGLNVSNESGEVWRAYGDGFFFTPANEVNRTQTVAALQQSADEVEAAYLEKEVQPTQIGAQIPTASQSDNFLPLYRIEDDKFFIYRDDIPIPIQGKMDFTIKAIPLALGELPDCINAFIAAYILPFKAELPSQLDTILEEANKIVVPRIERLTGKIWHVVAIASRYQLKTIDERNAALDEELMSNARSSYQQGKRLLQGIESFQEATRSVDDKCEIASMREAVSTIQTAFSRLQSSCPFDDPEWAETIQSSLHSSAYRLLSAFLNTQKDSVNPISYSLVKAYVDTQFRKGSPDEKRLEATLWFQRMLDYQAVAFATYLELKYRNSDGRRLDARSVVDEAAQIERHLKQCVLANRASIIPELLFCPEGYVRQRFLGSIQEGSN